MNVRKGLKLTTVCGESFLVAMGEENVDFSKIVALNESSLFMWKRMEKGPFTVDDLVDALLEEYDAPRGQILADVENVVKEFKQEKVIID